MPFTSKQKSVERMDANPIRPTHIDYTNSLNCQYQSSICVSSCGCKGWQDIAVQNVEEMIKRDWNRPSVVLWGVRINESADHDGFYARTNRVAKELDSDRQTGGVRNFGGSRLLEDVYTYNDFVHNGLNEALQPRRRVSKKDVPAFNPRPAGRNPFRYVWRSSPPAFPYSYPVSE